MCDNVQQTEPDANRAEQPVPTLTKPPPRRSAAATEYKNSGEKKKEKRSDRISSHDKDKCNGPSGPPTTAQQSLVNAPCSDKPPPKGSSELTSTKSPTGFGLPDIKDARPVRTETEEAAAHDREKSLSAEDYAGMTQLPHYVTLGLHAYTSKQKGSSDSTRQRKPKGSSDPTYHCKSKGSPVPTCQRASKGSSDPTHQTTPHGSSAPIRLTTPKEPSGSTCMPQITQCGLASPHVARGSTTTEQKQKGPYGPTSKQKPSDAHQWQQCQDQARPYGQAAGYHSHGGSGNEPAASHSQLQRTNNRTRSRERCSTPPKVLTNKSSSELGTSIHPGDRALHTAMQQAVAAGGRKREPKGPYGPSDADNATGPFDPISVKLQRVSSDTSPSRNHDSPAPDSSSIASCHHDSSGKAPSGSPKTQSHLRPRIRQPSARHSHRRTSTSVHSCADGLSEPPAGAPDNFPSVLGHFCSTFERHARTSSPSSYRCDAMSTSARLQFVRLLDAIKSPRPTHTDLLRFQRELVHICGHYYPTGADIMTDVWNGGSVMAKLPFAVRCTLIERKMDQGDGSSWTLGQLLAHLDEVPHVLREADAYSAKSPQQPSGSRGTLRRPLGAQAPAASSSEQFSEARADTVPMGPKKRQCPFCRLKGKHWATDCPHYANVSKRYARAIELNLCIHCLGKDHQAPKACRAPHNGFCDVCNDVHHHKALCTSFMAKRRAEGQPMQPDRTHRSSSTRALGGLPNLSAGNFSVHSDDEHKHGTQPNVGAKDDGRLVSQHGCGKRPSAQEAGAPHQLKASGPAAHRLYDGVVPSREPSGSLVPKQKRLSAVPVHVPSGNAEAASRVHVFVSTISKADFSTRQTRSDATRAIDQRDDTDHMVLTSSTDLLVAEQQSVTDHLVSPTNAASSDTTSPRKHHLMHSPTVPTERHLMLPPTEPTKHHLMLPAPHTDVLPANKNLPSEEAVLEPSGSPALHINENTDMDEPYGSLPLNIDEDADLVEPSGSNQPDKSAYVQQWAATAQVTSTEPSAELREFYNRTFNTTTGRKPHRHDYLSKESSRPKAELSLETFMKKAAITAKAYKNKPAEYSVKVSSKSAEYSAKPSNEDRHQAGKSPSRPSTTDTTSDLSDASLPFKLPTTEPAGAELVMKLFEKYRSKFDLSTPQRAELSDHLVAKVNELNDDFEGDFAQHYLASLGIMQRFVSSDTAKKRDGDDPSSLTERLQLSDFMSHPSTSNQESNQVSSDTIEQVTSDGTEYQSIAASTIEDGDGSLDESDEEPQCTVNDEEQSNEDELS